MNTFIQYHNRNTTILLRTIIKRCKDYKEKTKFCGSFLGGGGYDCLHQRLANKLCKEQDSKYFAVCVISVIAIKIYIMEGAIHNT